ncbi:DUF6082 family protein [Streptomyces sp. NPDC002574]|uniref:DUF6082 family protein n=1 Tax=Streptomyces sp. NPDC002574 TaxID=3364652 RepID=UPI0036A47D98
MARTRDVGGIAALLVAGVTGILVITATVAVALGKLMVALASPSGSDSAASTFMAANAAFSGLALAAVLVTFGVQQRKAQLQRKELVAQRKELSGTHSQLYRSAETELRTLHVELLKIGIENPELASVWPELEAVPAEQARELLYANMIFTHHLFVMRLGSLSTVEFHGVLRDLARGRKFREYWAWSRPYRQARLDPAGDEARLGALVDSFIQEIERNGG